CRISVKRYTEAVQAGIDSRAMQVGPLVLLAALLAGCQAKGPAPSAGVRGISASNPLILSADGITDRETAPSNSPNTPTKAGAEDELPDGPASFDADDQGNLYIADPLRNRIAVFDSRGGYQRAVQNGFSADRVFIDATGTLMARNASSGAWQRISESGASP